MARVGLPLYPFERERYSMETSVIAPTPAEETNVAEFTSGARLRIESFERWLYPARAPEAAEGTGPILLYLDEFGIGAGVGDALAMQSPTATPVLVRTGPRFARTGPREFRLGDQPADLDRLLETLAAEELLPARVCDFRGLSGPGEERAITAETDPAAARRRFLERPLELARSLARISSKHVEILFYTNGIAAVTGAEHAWPEAHFLLGPLAVIPREYPWMTCRLVDLEEGLEARVRAALAELEFAPGDFAETKIAAYRSGVRWVRGFDSPAAERITHLELRRRLRPGGVYVIAGGSGGIGRLIAGHLLTLENLTVVRLSRNPVSALFPAPGSQEARERIFDLTVDITDRDATARAFAEIRVRFGPVRGLIHAAGLPAGGLIEQLDAAKIAATLAPRVDGTLNLLEAARADAPDFVLFCSSLGVQVGYAGQADYAAANAFLDGFAKKQFRKNKANLSNVLSVQWDRWRDTGMAGRGADVRTREIELSPERDWVLNEHRHQGRAFLPGTACLELVRETFTEDREFAPVLFDEVLFLQPVFADEGSPMRLLLILKRGGTGSGGGKAATHFFLLSRTATGEYCEHATGQIRALPESPPAFMKNAPPQSPVGARCTDGSSLLRSLARAGTLELGEHWTGARIDLWRAPDEIIASIEFPAVFANEVAAAPLHPALLDLSVGLARALASEAEGLLLPLSYRRFTLERPLPARLTSRIRRNPAQGADTLACTVEFFDPEHRPVGRIEAFTLKRITSNFLAKPVAPARGELYETLLARAESDEVGGLTPAAALEAFAALPLGLAPVVQVLAVDGAARRRLSGDTAPAPVTQHPRPHLATPYEAPGTPLTQTLAGLWGATLGIDQVGLHDNFFELGGDSLLALRLVPRARELGLGLEPGVLFRYPTVAALGQYLSETANASPGFEIESEDEEAIDPADLARARNMVRYRQ